MTNITNPISALNNQKKKFFKTSKGENIYIRIITEAENMIKRTDCSEMLRQMLNLLEFKNSPLPESWIEGYNNRIINNKRCENDNYTYFILEKEDGKAIAMVSGNIYPNNKEPNSEKYINLMNMFVSENYRSAGLGQMLLSKIPTIVAKRTESLDYIIKPLSQESIESNNEEKYTNMAKKAQLTSFSTLKNPENLLGGKWFKVNNQCKKLTYKETKEKAGGFRSLVCNKHSFEIQKKSGWER